MQNLEFIAPLLTKFNLSPSNCRLAMAAAPTAAYAIFEGNPTGNIEQHSFGLKRGARPEYNSKSLTLLTFTSFW